MDIPLIGLFLVICLAALTALRYFAKTAHIKEDSYTTADSLLTPHECVLFAALERTLPGTYRIFPKPRLSAVVVPSGKLSSQQQQTARRHADRFSVTFAICEQPKMKVIAVVLCGEHPGAGDDSAYVHKVLAANKIPLVIFKAKPEYYQLEVWVKLSEACPDLFVLPSSPSQQVAKSVQPSEDITRDEVKSHPALATPAPQPAAAPSPEPSPTVPPVSLPADTHPCPACSGTLIRRQVKKGPHTGKFFRVCSNFPTCRQMVALPDAAEPFASEEQQVSLVTAAQEMPASPPPEQSPPAAAAPEAAVTAYVPDVPPPVDTTVQPITTSKPMLLNAAVTAQPVSAIPAAVPALEPQHNQTCPACGKDMVKMQVAKGAHAGKFFWVRSGYPACRQLAAIRE